MLEKIALKNFIQNPEKIGVEDAKDIQHILQKYPYFAWGHGFLAYFAQQNDHKQYPQLLRNASIHSYSRGALRRFLKNKPFGQETLKVEDIFGEKITEIQKEAQEEKNFFDQILNTSEENNNQAPKEDDFFAHLNPKEEPVYEYTLINEGKALGFYYEGRYREAILMYRKLAQIYPEKNAYYKEQLLDMLGDKKYSYKQEIKNFDLTLTQKEENVVLGIETLDEIKTEIKQEIKEDINTSNQKINTETQEKIEQPEKIQEIPIPNNEEKIAENTTEISENLPEIIAENTTETSENLPEITTEKVTEISEIIVPKQSESLPLIEKIETKEEKIDWEKKFFETECEALKAFLNKKYRNIKESLRIYEDLKIQNEKRADYYHRQMDAIAITPSFERPPIKNIYFDHTRIEECTEELAIKLYTHERSAEAIFIYEKLIETNPKKEGYYRAQIGIISEYGFK